jgi:hypothetical protein
MDNAYNLPPGVMAALAALHARIEELEQRITALESA